VRRAHAVVCCAALYNPKDEITRPLASRTAHREPHKAGPADPTERPARSRLILSMDAFPVFRRGTGAAAAAAADRGGDGAPGSTEELPMILCCLCGTSIRSNPSNMCINCLRSQVDITVGISKQVTMFFCRNCGRYQGPPWMNCELESRELLALCLKKIKGLNKEVKLVDASFIYTEPHSRRIKVKVTVQKEVVSSSIMQQSFVVEFVVANQQCEDCQRSFTEHTWNAVVQLRQKVQHKRTFYWLEQLFIKHSVAAKAINIKEQPDGLDFFFTGRSPAMHVLGFLQAVVPIRWNTGKRLVSQDLHSNTYNYKYTFAVEIAPICKDDLVLLPAKVAAAAGGMGPLAVCLRVSSLIHLMDPLTLKRLDLNADKYWRVPFVATLNARHMIDYVVLDVNKASPFSRSAELAQVAPGGKFALAEVQIMRAADLGLRDEIITTLTHLGNVLKPGDHVLGYDVANATLEEVAVARQQRGRALPEVVLVRKHYPNRKDRQRQRRFKLRQLPKEVSEDMKKSDIRRAEEDYEQFLQDVEEDPETWAHLNMYRAKGSDAKAMVAAAAASSSSAAAAPKGDAGAALADEYEQEDDDFPEIPIDQLLEELKLDPAGAMADDRGEARGADDDGAAGAGVPDEEEEEKEEDMADDDGGAAAAAGGDALAKGPRQWKTAASAGDPGRGLAARLGGFFSIGTSAASSGTFDRGASAGAAAAAAAAAPAAAPVPPAAAARPGPAARAQARKKGRGKKGMADEDDDAW
jgi:nonsense-mediated mRNA decay protein 3